jgi:hypothetical protein
MVSIACTGFTLERPAALESGSADSSQHICGGGSAQKEPASLEVCIAGPNTFGGINAGVLVRAAFGGCTSAGPAALETCLADSWLHIRGEFIAKELVRTVCGGSAQKEPVSLEGRLAGPGFLDEMTAGILLSTLEPCLADS